MKKYIRIERANNFNDRMLFFKLHCSKAVEKYFTSDSLIFQYDRKIEDVDESILQIPAIATVITVAWAIGADVHAKKLDKAYLISLNKVKTVMESWYPEFSFSGTIIPRNIVSNRFFNDGYGLLFSGGIDSLASYIRHRSDKPNLICCEGGGVDIHSLDEKAKKRLIDFSDREGTKINFVRTNADKIINKNLLFREFGLDWWMNVCHEILLTGLCAPLTCVENIGNLLIASSFTREFRFPWGSHPLISNNISWGNIKVVHDCYKFSRQEKIRYIIKNYLRKKGYYPFLRVCTSQSEINCCKCEKCLRTITGLALEGIDPNKCGFLSINSRTFDFIKERFLKEAFLKRKKLIERKGPFICRLGDIFFWEDIQKHIPLNIKYNLCNSKQFFEWFRDFDVSGHIRISKLSQLSLDYIADCLAPLSCYLPESIRNFVRHIRKKFTH